MSLFVLCFPTQGNVLQFTGVHSNNKVNKKQKQSIPAHVLSGLHEESTDNSMGDGGWCTLHQSNALAAAEQSQDTNGQIIGVRKADISPGDYIPIPAELYLVIHSV